MNTPRNIEGKFSDNGVPHTSKNTKFFSLKRGFPIWWKGHVFFIIMVLMLFTNKSSWADHGDVALFTVSFLSECVITLLFITECFKGKA
ncbi:hypothetical protein [Mesobacillus zeae]|uniref:Uncharacterized protein n=1 Tax=Mesobacillus zeae TaxID=1917180 RepID=A0A398B111_9BACI|nr:hypothetical protein [Mesobacillus zeae]RID83609.1 hypothetical protein D1970_15415 [Mesobacillus zeae]